MRVEAVYGPPGTGKTTELLRRVQEAREAGVQAERVAFVSFTRAAAHEALSRLGLKRSDNVSTIHSMAFRQLRLRQAQVVDTAKLREFSTILGIPVVGKSPEDDEERADGDFYLDILNNARATFTNPAMAYDLSDRPGTRAEFDLFVRSYADWKSTYGYYDFSDMLERAVQRRVSLDAEVIFVDEAQDLSPLQWQVVDHFCRRSDEVHIAGDDDQAIYTWAGADPHGMASFCEKHGGHSQVLSVSHRLPVAVYEKSQALIRRVLRRVDKKFSSKGHLGLVRLHGSINSVDIDPATDTLLLARTHSVLREVERTLIDKRVPYLRESGRPGMYQNKIANAIRAFNKLADGQRLTDGERNSLWTQALPEVKRALDSGDTKSVVARPFYMQLDIPARVVDFYMDADLHATPQLRLSTIHSAKGMEAEHVVLLTDLTTRVQQTAEASPDDEVRVFYVGLTRSKNVLDIVEGYNGYKL
jgi:DNA helicase II / ATP-dependent DNA helicase PcrA